MENPPVTLTQKEKNFNGRKVVSIRLAESSNKRTKSSLIGKPITYPLFILKKKLLIIGKEKRNHTNFHAIQIAKIPIAINTKPRCLSPLPLTKTVKLLLLRPNKLKPSTNWILKTFFFV